MNPERILKGTFLFAAFASFLLSVTIYFQAGDDIEGRLNGIFVGIWVPSILALGTFVLAHKAAAEMSESGLFIAGALVSVIVFTGGFLYAMFSFGRWADRDELRSQP